MTSTASLEAARVIAIVLPLALASMVAVLVRSERRNRYGCCPQRARRELIEAAGEYAEAEGEYADAARGSGGEGPAVGRQRSADHSVVR